MLKRELNKKQIIIVSFVSLLLVVTAVGADMIMKSMPRKAAGQAATPSEAASVSDEKTPSYQYAQISSKLTEIVEDKPYEPSPDVLNLAYFYPDGADTTDVINSYAGRLYTELTTKEAQYMADIYDMSDRTPLNMAKALGLPTSRVLGKYNPNDASHSADNPATWTINSFKNANVAFYDGDGNRINAYSTVKEIMSMASVYAYYHGMYDYESMRDYALKLWEHSHSYTISMGNVYYDSGCLNKTIQQEAEEAIAQEKEQQLLEESLAQRTAASSGTQTVSYETTAGPANEIVETTLNDEATMFFDLGAESSGAGGDGSAANTASADGTEGAVLGTSGAEPSGAEATLPAAGGAENNTENGNATERLSGAGGNSVGSSAVQPVPAEQSGQSNQPGTAAPAASSAAETAGAATMVPQENETAAAGAAGGGTEDGTAAPEPRNEATFAAFSLTGGLDGLSYHGIQLAEQQEATLFGGNEGGAAAEQAVPPQNASSEGVPAAQSTSAAGAVQTQGAAGTAQTAGAAAPQSAPSPASGSGEQGNTSSLAAESTSGVAGRLVSGPEAVPAGTEAAASAHTEASETAGSEATMAVSGNTSSQKLTQSYCPGHVDLYITVKLYGIDDANGLMKFDTVGNDEANYNDEWQGWTEEMKAHARALNAEDWFKRYGLTISAINVRNPLTESEIDSYLARIPDTVSQTRKEVVSFALHSVGKVPYYWGGKPSAPRYEQNNYGTIVPPDTKGRVLRGLDCSGWINWVYWSALGNRLEGESTGTLIGCGERISRADLQPGDIIVRTGADAHVVMFLEWAGNGNMIVVHETGGVTNNVTVSEMSANWPYYRKLIQ